MAKPSNGAKPSTLPTRPVTPATWQDWVYFGLRWLLIIAVPVLVFIAQNRVFESFDSISDLVFPTAIAAVFNLILGGCIGIPPLRAFVPLVALAGDWVTTGLFVNVSAQQPLIIAAVVGITATLGLLRFGPNIGAVQVIGALIAAVIGLVTGLGDPAILQASLLSYVPVAVFVLLIAVIIGVWEHYFAQQSNIQGRSMRETMNVTSAELTKMRERSRTIAEMSARLNSTLNYERILDDIMDVGLLTLRESAKQRVLSMVLLFTPSEKLEIITERGLHNLDKAKILNGVSGIIPEALAEGTPVLGENGETDPELSQLIAFRSIQAVLVIPLRAGFDNFGVLVFASDRKRAFDEALVDMLTSFGTQATVALQNAVLYQNLKEERDRIIRLQEAARKELVRDLHDVPTQTMSAVAMRLGLIPKIMDRQPDMVKPEVEEIRGMALRATEEIRHVMFKLRPLVLESQGLAAALNQLAAEMKKTHKQHVEVDVDSIVERYLDVSQQGTLFQLIDEAAGNARKHANAPVIKVSVKFDKPRGMIMARVADNGAGFDPNHAGGETGHFGMINLRERAELLDGVLDLRSAPGRGTVITVAIPLDSKKEQEVVTQASRPSTKLGMAAAERLNRMTS